MMFLKLRNNYPSCSRRESSRILFFVLQNKTTLCAQNLVAGKAGSLVLERPEWCQFQSRLHH